MNDWRRIPVKDIDWSMLYARFGRSVYALKWLSKEPRHGRVVDRGYGCWSHLTLGEVSDLGRRVIMRHHNIGEKALETLQAVIDLAAAGDLPMIGAPAPDALQPSNDQCPGPRSHFRRD